MTHDDKQLQEWIGKRRKLKGLCPMSDEDADAAFEAAPEDSMREEEIQAVTEAVVSGELASWEPLPELDWTEKMDLHAVEQDALQLFRNKGEDDSETSDAEEKLRQEMLTDDDE
jgi:hypothetical protein